jgi:hypothetical protein
MRNWIKLNTSLYSASTESEDMSPTTKGPYQR